MSLRLSISERLYQQRLLIAYVEQDGTLLERVWLPVLRLAHRLTLREAIRAGLDKFGQPTGYGYVCRRDTMGKY